MITDSDRVKSDVLVEISVTLEEIRRVVRHLSLDQSLRAERLPQNGQDHLDRSQPLGTVLILADECVPLARSVLPLIYAVAAGNTPILVLHPSVKPFSNHLEHLICTSGVDQEAVGILNPKSAEERDEIIQHLSQYLIHGVVPQSSSDADSLTRSGFPQVGLRTSVINGIPGPIVTIVTRHAQVADATTDLARAIVYGLHQRQAIVIVDEFVLESFGAALRQSLPTLTDTSLVDGKAYADACELNIGMRKTVVISKVIARYVSLDPPVQNHRCVGCSCEAWIPLRLPTSRTSKLNMSEQKRRHSVKGLAPTA